MIVIQSLWQYYKYDPLDDGKTKDVEIIVPLKYLRTFWRTLEMPLINCEINLILTWFRDCIITNSTGEGKFAITETKLLCSGCNPINSR